MPKFIVKLGDDKYCEWSTVVDAPVTPIVTLDELHEYYRQQYGEAGMEGLPARLARVEATGCSAFDRMTAEELIQGNRAGPREKELTLAEIIESYGQ